MPQQDMFLRKRRPVGSLSMTTPFGDRVTQGATGAQMKQIMGTDPLTKQPTPIGAPRQIGQSAEPARYDQVGLAALAPSDQQAVSALRSAGGGGQVRGILGQPIEDFAAAAPEQKVVGSAFATNIAKGPPPATGLMSPLAGAMKDKYAAAGFDPNTGAKVMTQPFKDRLSALTEHTLPVRTQQLLREKAGRESMAAEAQAGRENQLAMGRQQFVEGPGLVAKTQGDTQRDVVASQGKTAETVATTQGTLANVGKGIEAASNEKVATTKAGSEENVAKINAAVQKYGFDSAKEANLAIAKMQQTGQMTQAALNAMVTMRGKDKADEMAQATNREIIYAKTGTGDTRSEQAVGIVDKTTGQRTMFEQQPAEEGGTGILGGLAEGARRGYSALQEGSKRADVTGGSTPTNVQRGPAVQKRTLPDGRTEFKDAQGNTWVG